MARRGRPGHDLAAVVDAGAQVFTERGYDAATMDDVAARLGIAKSSLYHHVSGKEELLAHALERALGALEKAFDEADGAEVPAADRLERLLHAAVAQLIDELPSVTLLLRVRGNSTVQRSAMQRRRAFDARLAEVVAHAQRSGVVDSGIDPHLAARLLFGTVNSIAEWYRPSGSSRRDADRIASSLCRLLLGGASTPHRDAVIGEDRGDAHLAATEGSR